MAWGVKPSDTQEWIKRINDKDETFTALHAMPSRKFAQGSLGKLFQALPEAIYLKELYLSGHALSEEDLQSLLTYLPQNMSLESICIGDGSLGDSGTTTISAAVKDHPTIVKVDLSKKAMSSASCAKVASSMGKLEELTVAENPLGDEGCIALAKGLPSAVAMQDLDLAETNCGKDGAKSFGEVQCHFSSSGRCATS